MALVVNVMTGLEVVDLSTPSAPTLLATQNTPGIQLAVSASGSRAFVVDQPTGVILFDLSNPRVPAELGTLPTTAAPARTVALPTGDSDRVYVVYGRTGVVEAVDISDPASPRRLGSYAPDGRPQRVAVHGRTLYIPNGRAGVEVLDMTDPTAPAVSATYDTPGTAWMIAVTEDLLVVADGDGLVLLRRP